MITGIGGVAVYVTNQMEALKFYRDVLGFEVRRWEPLGAAGSWVEMAPPGAVSTLVIYPQALMPDYQQRRAYILMQCDNVTTTFEELTAQGVQFLQEPESLGWAEIAIFTDPYGNEFTLMQVTKEARPVGGNVPRPPGGGPPPPPPPPR